MNASMAIVMICFGFLVTIMFPMIRLLRMQKKNLNEQEMKDFALWIAFMPGFVILAVGIYFYKNQAIEPSTACGEVQYYKENYNKKNPFERIVIQFEGSKYYRHLNFDANIARKQAGEQVCFEFYDKSKYSYLSNSEIVRWIEQP